MNKYHYIMFFFMLFLLLYCGSGNQLEGVASWYGTEWHGKETANGEIYDMYSMTAAHRTLPFGTIVKVKDKDSGREVVVRINNRGPFIKGRVIDLSYAAAQKLDIVDKGVTPCKITILKMPK
jgi:rare lipoprotein A